MAFVRLPTFCARNIAVVAILWSGLVFINRGLLAFFQVDQFANLVFLPAGFRLLAIMILEWDAVIGIILGRFVFGVGVDEGGFLEMVPVALIAGFAPFIAVLLASRYLSVSSNLRGLKPAHLWVYAFLAAFFNAVLTQVYLTWAKDRPDLFQNIALMFLGNFIGSIIVLFLMSWMVNQFIFKSREKRDE